MTATTAPSNIRFAADLGRDVNVTGTAGGLTAPLTLPYPIVWAWWCHGVRPASDRH